MNFNSYISLLIKKLFSGKISKDELKDLNDWYDSKLTGEEVLIDSFESKEQIKNRMLSKLKNEIRIDEKRNEISLSRFRQIGGMVASIAAIILISITLFINLQRKKSDEKELATSNITYLERANPNGQKSKIILTDGTVVWLNAASKIRFPEKFDLKERRVFLEGEAFFDVTRDENRPFVIQSKSAVTTVLGTTFNVKSYEKEPIQITVASGKVKVNMENAGSLENDELVLIQNEQITFSPESGELIKKNVDSNYFLSWKEDIIRFDNSKLSEVAKTLERWYDKKITIENEKLNNCKLVAEYKNEKLYNVLLSLKFSLGIDFKVLDDEIVISGTGCN
jgi:ferric-dicitrate binding protein FerR (iron transport regulator)